MADQLSASRGREEIVQFAVETQKGALAAESQLQFEFGFTDAPSPLAILGRPGARAVSGAG
jgi:hypothetical protein